MDITSKQSGIGGAFWWLLAAFLIWALVKSTGQMPEVQEINTWLKETGEDLGISIDQLWHSIHSAGSDALREIPKLFENIGG